MHKRIHPSLDYLIPVEFETQSRAQGLSLAAIPPKWSFLCPVSGGRYRLEPLAELQRKRLFLMLN